ncbi:MAG: D-ribose pyranase [Eubacteriales bacterium]
MKRTGILNSQLMQQIAALGHTDTFLIGDAGMPVPNGVPIIDLVLVLGVPTFEQVLRAVLAETVVEAGTIAEEAAGNNPAAVALIHLLIAAPIKKIPHTDLKNAAKTCKFAIRTGEATPYANIILQSGVSFLV